MKRLTFNGDFCDIAVCLEQRGGGFCVEGACSQKKVWDRLKEYEDLDEKGLLLKVPCKNGDEVYYLRRHRNGWSIKRGEVCELYFVEDMRLGISIKSLGCGEWGKTVFSTYEEAAEEITRKERSNEQGKMYYQLRVE